MITETQNRYRMEDLFNAIRSHGPTFDNIEFAVTSLWDEKAGSFRYCRMVRVTRDGGNFTLWIHTLKGDMTHVVYSVNGLDLHIDSSQFPWGHPDEWQARKMINEFMAEVAG